MCDEKTARARRRGARPFQDTIENRNTKAEMLVQLGELSSARHALEGAALAPGDNATLTALPNDAKRPSRPREPLHREVVEHVARTLFDLHEKQFSPIFAVLQTRSSGEPSGVTSENLRPLLDDWSSMQVLVKVAEMFAQAEIPESVVQIVKLGRLTALSKPDGEVRSIVAGDVFRKLVARTMSKQLGQVVMKATSPISMLSPPKQYANASPTRYRAL